ncbi:helix-turn-helix transcriptional regulator [Persicimonas caeni]|uniref:Helix-turn-helix transcriptional regulator n=1 Tax=Persicimonas caeni TaxID=2292766 RepID=A0A4Y6PV21_PERCE|nr:helix-turn-helix transcriptional regulator [Persicimonas caeni]QDG52191.1 helix-turn-helix transcriptional regulator [Persicimonas caeni]QED33413.1 helix-turn-helix transcriptional regulator [Persicimonas caeni]
MSGEKELRKLLGERIARLRKQAGLSQTKLGKLIGGVHQTMISQIEAGDRGIPDERLSALAGALGVDEAELTVDSLGESGSGKVSSEELRSAWRDRVAMDPSLDPFVMNMLMMVSAPVFRPAGNWLIHVTVEQFARETGRDLQRVEQHWQQMVDTPYLERVGEVEWAFWMTFP